MEKIGKLSNLQMELLKMFHYNLTDSQLLELKKVLSSFFAKKLTEEMDQFWDENKWDEKTIESLKNEHLRTKYE